MPFFIATSKAPISPALLESRLAPYKGKISVIENRLCRIFHTSALTFSGGALRSLAATENGFYEIALSNEEVRVESDLMGCYPLWSIQANDGEFAASEVKSFSAISGFSYDFLPEVEVCSGEKKPRDYSPFRNIRNRSQDQLRIRPDGWHWDPKPPLRPKAPPPNPQEALEQALLSLREKFPKAEEVVAFLSGGIDSSVAASLLGKRKHAVTLSTELGNEVPGAQSVAKKIGAQLEIIDMKQGELLTAVEDAIFFNEVFDGLTAEVLGQILHLTHAAKAKRGPIISGYGSDLLFGGMLKHEAYMKAVGASDTADLISRTCWTGEFRPIIAMAKGKSIWHFFWNAGFMETALSIPIEQNFSGTHDKFFLREAAVRLGLLDRAQAFAPKKGLTDGTQAHRLLSRAIGLPDGHHYQEKTRWAYAKLRTALEALQR